MPYRIECVLECGNHLGEGPIWDVEEGRLYWVDGTGRRVGNPSIWRLDPRTGRTDTWSIGHDVGALALRRDGGAQQVAVPPQQVAVRCGACTVAVVHRGEAFLRAQLLRHAPARLRQRLRLGALESDKQQARHHAFAQLRTRLRSCEPSGRAERVRSSFVGGIKRAPMRWEIVG